MLRGFRSVALAADHGGVISQILASKRHKYIVTKGGTMSRFKYTIHNVIGHPLMELFHLVGLERLASWIHDITLPSSWEEDYDNSWDAGEETNL